MYFKMCEESSMNDYAHDPSLSMEEITQRYTDWARDQKYEHDLREENYKGPSIVAKFVSEHFTDGSSRKNVSVLDVAAGTGFVGEKMKQAGFSKIDALEPSEGMLNLARQKNIYTRTFQDYLNDEPTSIESDHYDVALICGGMGHGHIPCSGLKELVRVVKPGGLVFIVMREEYLRTVDEYRDKLEPYMKELTLDGRWEPVSRRIVPCYSFQNDGVVYIYRVKQ